jgi:hypothetical protein
VLILPIKYIKFLFAIGGLICVVTGIEDGNIKMVGIGLAAAVAGFILGIGLEHSIVRIRNEQRLTGGTWRISESGARNVLIMVGAVLLTFVILGWIL